MFLFHFHLIHQNNIFTDLLSKNVLFSSANNSPKQFIGVKYTSNGNGTVRVGDGTKTMNNAVSICIKSLNVPAQIFENGISYDVTEIGEWAFYNCDTLETVTIGKNVVKIGEYAFSDCDSIVSITFDKDSSLKTIGRRAFTWCSLKHIEIPSSVKSIGDSTFNSRGIMKTFVYCGNNFIANKIFCKNPDFVLVSNNYKSQTYGLVPVKTSNSYCAQ